MPLHQCTSCSSHCFCSDDDDEGNGLFVQSPSSHSSAVYMYMPVLIRRFLRLPLASTKTKALPSVGFFFGFDEEEPEKGKAGLGHPYLRLHHTRPR